MSEFVKDNISMNFHFLIRKENRLVRSVNWVDEKNSMKDLQKVPGLTDRSFLIYIFWHISAQLEILME